MVDESTEAIHHAIAFPGLDQQWVDITTRFPNTEPELVLHLPTWAPGSYLQQPFDASLEVLAVRSGDEALAWEKTGRDRWSVAARGAAVEVRYRVRADQRGVATSWVSQDHVLLNGSSVFLYTESQRDAPQVLTVQAPPGLPVVSTPLPGAGPGRWRARDYDQLVDSPVVLTERRAEAFRADGRDYRLLQVGDDRLWDTGQAVADLGALVKATHALFDEVPLERPYWFINVLNEESGGLEHDDATVMQASRWQMLDRRNYLQWLSLAAHEYLHAWNIRRLRPKALARYDYRRPQVTGELWVAEGLSSYYDDLLLSRARIATPPEYLERLARQIHTLEQTPGRFHQSLVQASRDAWTRHYQPGPNAVNQNVSYYVKGAVVGFVLDARLREDSRGRRSLDDVLRAFWARWNQVAYPEGAFFDAVAAVADRETVEWLRPMVEGTAEPDVDAALAWFGLELERHPARAAAAATGRSAPAGLGINWTRSGGNLVAAAVIDGGAAARAGVLPGDELLAVDGERLTFDDYEVKLRRLPPGKPVTLLLTRQGRVLERRATLGEARPTHYEVRAARSFGERERRRLRDWLGQPLGGD